MRLFDWWRCQRYNVPHLSFRWYYSLEAHEICWFLIYGFSGELGGYASGGGSKCGSYHGCLHGELTSLYASFWYCYKPAYLTCFVWSKIVSPSPSLSSGNQGLGGWTENDGSAVWPCSGTAREQRTFQRGKLHYVVSCHNLRWLMFLGFCRRCSTLVSTSMPV